jgi:hypothetical protein
MDNRLYRLGGAFFFALVSASAMIWAVEGYFEPNHAEVHMKLPATTFSPDFSTARRRFIEIAKSSGGRLETIPLDVKGPGGENLGIDIAWFGAENSRRVLLHSSGLHGVEGFAGSAIQLQLLSNLPALPSDTALVVVHVLNPYGMAWLRRFNENNVDLNRNFLGQGEYAGAPEAYSTLNSFLNPESPPAWDLYTLRAGWLVLRYGLPSLKVAVVGGQYEYSKGLFFGGKHMEQMGLRYQSFLSERLASTERVVSVDVHTGIGDYGQDILMVEPDSYAKLRAMFGQRVAAPDPTKSDSYPVRGALDTLYARTLPKTEILAVTQEFGTYSPIKVLHSLREENRWHQYGAGTLDHPAKKDLKDAFCPEDEKWREAVLKRGGELLQQALSTAFRF